MDRQASTRSEELNWWRNQGAFDTVLAGGVAVCWLVDLLRGKTLWVPVRVELLLVAGAFVWMALALAWAPAHAADWGPGALAACFLAASLALDLRSRRKLAFAFCLLLLLWTFLAFDNSVFAFRGNTGWFGLPYRSWRTVIFGAGPGTFGLDVEVGGLSYPPQWLKLLYEYGWAGMAASAGVVSVMFWGELRALCRLTQRRESLLVPVTCGCNFLGFILMIGGGAIGRVIFDPVCEFVLAALLLSPLWFDPPLEAEEMLRFRLEYRWVSLDLLAQGMRKLLLVGLTVNSAPRSGKANIG